MFITTLRDNKLYVVFLQCAMLVLVLIDDRGWGCSVVVGVVELLVFVVVLLC